MRRRRAAPPTPSHHLIVERADWSAILEARRLGVSWDDLRTRTGLPTLGMAIFEGSPLAVQTLLEMGAPIDTVPLFNNTLFSPLWAALEKKNAQIVDVLLQAGCDPNEQHPDYGSALQYAALHGLGEETLVLCRHGASPNTDRAPSPVWLWIKNLAPQHDQAQDRWIFPDSRPILALLRHGARIAVDDEQDDQSSIGLNEIDFAKRQWFKHPLKGQDLNNALMTLASMERNLLTHGVEDAHPNQEAPSHKF